MTRGILIAGNESSLFSAALLEAAKRVETFCYAPIPNRFILPQGSSPPRSSSLENAIPLSWNPSSPISARTLILAAENQMKQINNAILICSPPGVYKTPETLSPEEIEILVNDHMKGWFFLVRELCQYFLRTGSGSLSLVAPESQARGRASTQTDLLGPSAASSFRLFAQALVSSEGGRQFQIMGFSSPEAGGTEEAFAEWLFGKIDRSSPREGGRWHRFPKWPLLRKFGSAKFF